ncbi:hypothetical protein C1T17_08930 [Sphingobium sp. SCG-1]|uniref:hypothetical protein n=1 Tax=Sphingobium sp. SCG-1 TaxID=2072936 RepID=UPI000CD69DB9|nr:hypothetical protein [Sphingobium sp. SCG-1]AUW58211.1 hypothetical protein C1T17_08930 [Sphingobium sp. SCG-1]
MATTAGWTEERSFSIGKILRRAFGVMGDNPVPVFGIAFFFGALPQQLYTYLVNPAMLAANPNNAVPGIILSIGSSVVFLMFGMLVQGAIVRATAAYANGSRATFGESVGTGLSMALPLIGLTILLILGLMLGFILLVIPGIMLYIMWSVAAPALVVEETGVFAAFGRSRFLTKGARWKIFGLQILLVVVFMLLSSVVGVMMVASGGLQNLAAQMADGQLPVSYIIAAVISGTLMTAFWSATQTSLYISLREWKEGPQAEALANVFA